MKKYLLIIIMLFLTIPSAISAKDNDKTTTVFTVSPNMSCQNCENKIKNFMRFEKGVSNIATDLKEQTVSITYNPKKTDPDKLAKAFKKIGYTATPLTTEKAKDYK